MFEFSGCEDHKIYWKLLLSLILVETALLVVFAPVEYSVSRAIYFGLAMSAINTSLNELINFVRNKKPTSDLKKPLKSPFTS